VNALTWEVTSNVFFFFIFITKRKLWMIKGNYE